MSWEASRVALEQQVDHQLNVNSANPVDRAIREIPGGGLLEDANNSARTAENRAVFEMTGVGARYLDSVQGIADPPRTPDGRGWDQMSPMERQVAGLHKEQQALGAVLGAMNLLQDMADVGFANLTDPIAAALPSFPAATLGMLYLGIPHAHDHPPSLVPPAPPIPMPSLGPILLGTSVRVLINGLPAARSGDIGLAPTCCGLAPFFQIFTGSSNVFIGGARAARMLDICIACGKGEGRTLGGVMGAMAMAESGLDVEADVGDALVDTDPAMQAAEALAAAMNAAQMAADAVAMALSQAMGLDPCIPPIMGPPGLGMVIMGMPNVLIGGFPMPNIPNPAEALLKALRRLATRGRGSKTEDTDCGKPGCPV
jgi:uncharacterized Zn-binding protein involved in type VI secretion